MKKILLLFSICTTSFAQTSVESILKSDFSGRQDLEIPVSENPIQKLPVIILKGKQQGPVLSVVAGVHGYEYPPIVAVQELLQEIDPEKITGTLIIIPIANTASFFGRTPFVNPIDRKNLNKAFPGNASGSATEKLARIITDEIIRHSDIFLDIHGGDASEDLLPFVCYYDNPQHPKETELAARLCQASGMENVVSYPYHLKKNDAAQYAFKQAVQDGKIALSIEAGKLGTVQDSSVKIIKSGVYGILDDAEVYDNNQKISIEHRNYFKDQSYVKSSSEGIFHSPFKAGDNVRKGELGYITDIFGKQIEKFSAPANGVILYKIGTPPVKKDETVFCIGIK